MDINITRFWNDAEPFNYSASRMELGENAGKITWNRAVADSSEYNFLDDDDKREEFRAYVKIFGAWDVEEIAAWSNDELNALLIQMISGDIREVPDMNGPEDWNWELYEQYAEAGTCSSRIWKNPGESEVFYYIGE